MSLKKWFLRVISLCMASCFLTGSIEIENNIHAEEKSMIFNNVNFSEIDVNEGEAIKGVDISSVISLENSGVIFKNKDGQEQDIFLTLKQNGINYIRVRVWNDPYNSSGNTYGGGANDVQTAVKIGQRCAKYGLKMLVDFHYSDFWADPGKQVVPKKWSGLSTDQKANEIKEFTGDSLKKISASGVKIGMVQIGNETNSGMCGETEWKNISVLMKSASEAIRGFDKNILISVHFTNPEKKDLYSYFAQQLNNYNVDYDVFASSYYPYWHGTISNLTSVLKNISDKYNKYVMVAETSWVNTFEDTDHFGNTISSDDELGNYVSYDVSVQGQINCVTDVFKAVSDAGAKGIGAFYWEPAWITVGDTYDKNNLLWERYGSGWATASAGEYQSDAAKYHGGSAVDNQALFNKNGVPLDSLSVFSHIISKKTDQDINNKKNLLINYGFEDDLSSTDYPKGWKIKNTTKGQYSKFTVNSEMNRSGNYAVHWYSPESFSDSSVSTELISSESGDYNFRTYIAGSKCEYTVNAYVSGILKGSMSGKTTGYDKWNEVCVNFSADTGEKIMIEIKVNGENESFGSIDDCGLYITEKPQANENTDDSKLCGDIDGDGRISVHDIIKFRNYMTGVNEFNLTQYQIADMNNDSAVDIIDVILLLEKILNL